MQRAARARDKNADCVSPAGRPAQSDISISVANCFSSTFLMREIVYVLISSARIRPPRSSWSSRHSIDAGSEFRPNRPQPFASRLEVSYGPWTLLAELGGWSLPIRSTDWQAHRGIPAQREHFLLSGNPFMHSACP